MRSNDNLQKPFDHDVSWLVARKITGAPFRYVCYSKNLSDNIRKKKKNSSNASNQQTSFQNNNLHDYENDFNMTQTNRNETNYCSYEDVKNGSINDLKDDLWFQSSFEQNEEKKLQLQELQLLKSKMTFMTKSYPKKQKAKTRRLSSSFLNDDNINNNKNHRTQNYNNNQIKNLCDLYEYHVRECCANSGLKVIKMICYDQALREQYMQKYKLDHRQMHQRGKYIMIIAKMLHYQSLFWRKGEKIALGQWRT